MIALVLIVIPVTYYHYLSCLADPNKDYFSERVEKKKERVAKNETQRLKNLARQLGTSMRKGPSVDASIGIGVAPEEKSKEQVTIPFCVCYSLRYSFFSKD